MVCDIITIEKTRESFPNYSLTPLEFIASSNILKVSLIVLLALKKDPSFKTLNPASPTLVEANDFFNDCKNFLYANKITF